MLNKSVIEKLSISRGVLLSLTTGVVFLLAVYAIHRLLAEVSYSQLKLQLLSLPHDRLLMAIGATAVSFLALTGYDGSALAYLKRNLPYRTVFMAAFCGYAIGNTVGFSLISGGAVRYRIYRGAGLDSIDVARITAFSALSFGIGIHVVGGVALLWHPEALAPLVSIPAYVLRILGAAIVLALFGAWLYSGKNPRELSLWKWRIPLPEPRLSLTQLGITILDIVSCGTCLYVLLPPSTLPFPAFLLVFVLAIFAGLITHVPGGLGVFETVMLYALGSRISPEALTAALIAFRGIYYFMPLLLATAILAGLETIPRLAPAWSRLAQVGRWAGPLVPTMAAGLGLVSGLVLLVSAVTPTAPERMATLRNFLPLVVVETSHILSALVGLALLVISNGLHRRLNGAWMFALVFCGAGIVLVLAKGIEYEEALVLGLMVLALLLTRREFYRRTALLNSPLDARWTIALLSAVGGMVWVGLFAFKHVEYSHSLWLQFEYNAHAPRALRATLAVLLVTVPLAFFALLRPPRRIDVLPGMEDLRQAAALLPRQNSTMAHLALMGDKYLLFDRHNAGYLMYGVQGRSWIALGDPIGSADVVEELAWEFRERVDRDGGRIAFYQVRPDQLPLYLDMNLWPLKLGEEALVPLARFSLEGSSGADFRYALRRGEKEGLRFEIAGTHRFETLLPSLQSVSDAWLDSKEAREKRFSMGAFLPDYLRHFEFALVYREDRLIAFANLLTAAAGTEASVDLMRHVPDVPNSAMEYLFIQLMLHFKAAGYRTFNLGMSPLSGLEHHPLAPRWHRFGSQLYSHGEPYYNFQGLRHFKEKFHPDWEPRYLVCQGGIQPVLILADIAALIAGGYRGIVAK